MFGYCQLNIVRSFELQREKWQYPIKFTPFLNVWILSTQHCKPLGPLQCCFHILMLICWSILPIFWWILGIFSYIDKHSPSRPFYPLVAPRILFQFLTFRFVFCIFGWGKSIETSLPRSRPATPHLPHLAQISTGELWLHHHHFLSILR